MEITLNSDLTTPLPLFARKSKSIYPYFCAPSHATETSRASRRRDQNALEEKTETRRFAQVAAEDDTNGLISDVIRRRATSKGWKKIFRVSGRPDGGDEGDRYTYV